ncbi:hypothetical protein KBB27_03685 [Patescibacteria group bacterium]|nr:hypothetical protein [Patescibacteria group bacterium]
MKPFFFLFALALCFPIAAHADLNRVTPQPYALTPVPMDATWVSPTGSDLSGDGTQANPFSTPTKAASLGKTVVLEPGRYPLFGRLAHGGTSRSPLVIRPATTTAPIVFVFQDAQQPAIIAASHIRIEGITLSGEELANPGACAVFGTNVDDVAFQNVTFKNCAQGIDTIASTWNHGVIQDSFFRDISDIGIDCRGSCIHQRWNRVRLEHIGQSASSSGIFVSASSNDIRLRDVFVRDITGDGASFLGGPPSIANSVFTQISGTALTLANGGFVGRTEINTQNQGIFAHIGNNLTIERSLIHKFAIEAVPFQIASNDASSPSSTLLLAYSRIEAGTSTLALAGTSSRHQIELSGTVFWFADQASTVRLPNRQTIEARTLLEQKNIQQADDSMLVFVPPNETDLFTPLFSGGDTVHYDNNRRTITSGSQIRGNIDDPAYVLGQNAHVHLLGEIAKTWYPYPSDIQTIGDSAFGSLLRGGDITLPPGTLIKAKTRPEVYLITAPNIIRWIKTEALAEAFGGPRWNQELVELPGAELTKYQEGTSIENEDAFSEADVLRQIPDPSDLYRDDAE